MGTHAFRSDGCDEARDEWLVAENLSGKRHFLVHACAPRFIARIFDEDESGGVLDGLSYSLPGGGSLAEFAWLDPIDFIGHPVEPDLLDLLTRAGEALAEYDRRLGLEED
jgi:hypothetical protein